MSIIYGPLFIQRFFANKCSFSSNTIVFLCLIFSMRKYFFITILHSLMSSCHIVKLYITSVEIGFICSITYSKCQSLKSISKYISFHLQRKILLFLCHSAIKMYLNHTIQLSTIKPNVISISGGKYHLR